MTWNVAGFSTNLSAGRHIRVRVLFAGLILCVLVLVSGGGGLPSQATSSSAPSEVLYSEDFESGRADGWELSAAWTISGDALGILVSGAGGRSWQSLNPGLPSKQVYSIARHPTAPLTLYAVTLRGFARSADGGNRWDLIGPRTVSGIPRAVAVDPIGGAIYLAATGSMNRSFDAGKTWQLLPTRIDPNAEVRAIAISPADDKLSAIAELRTGAYMSWGRGDTWTKVTRGPRTRAVNDSLFSADGRTLYAATEGEGLFGLDLTPAGG